MSNYLPLKMAPENICILRLSALGDVSHTLAVVRAIQKAWPDTKITWICGKLEYKLLSSIVDINFIVFDKRAGWKEYFKLRRKLSGQRFDVLLQMQVAARANIVSALIKAKIRLGWDKARSRDFHQCFINHTIKQSRQQHQLQGFLAFARALGIGVEQPEWNWPITTAAREFVAKHVPDNKPVLLISPCSSHSLRNWSAKKYAEVADYAVNKLGMQVVLSGGLSELEKNMGEEIQHCMSTTVVNLIGKDTLQQSVALLHSADIVISPDSGPAHIADAVGTPVIGLYACTWSKRSGPYNSLDICVDKFEQAAEKYLHKAANELRWGTKIEQADVMELIEVNEVCQRLDRLV